MTETSISGTARERYVEAVVKEYRVDEATVTEAGQDTVGMMLVDAG